VVSVATTPVFDTRLVIDVIAVENPKPNIALYVGGGGCAVTLIPPVNVIPPVKSIIVFL
jgi:hypothetical protein